MHRHSCDFGRRVFHSGRKVQISPRQGRIEPHILERFPAAPMPPIPRQVQWVYSTQPYFRQGEIFLSVTILQPEYGRHDLLPL